VNVWKITQVRWVIDRKTMSTRDIQHCNAWEGGMASAIPHPEENGAHLHSPEIESERAARRAAAPRHSVGAFEGDLRECDFASLLHMLHVERATGVLMMQNKKKKKALQLRDGHPVSVKSNLVEECLGHTLVRQQIISEEQASSSLAQARKQGGLQGEILLAMELIDEDRLAEALRAQAVDKLYEIFTWKRGRFAFKPGKRIKGGNGLALDYSVANMILAGCRDYVPSRRVDDFFDRFALVEMRRASNEFDRFQDVTVSQAEEKVICEVADGVLVSEYVAETDHVRRAVYGLVATGLVDTDGEPAPPARDRDPEEDDSMPDVMPEGLTPAPPSECVETETREMAEWLDSARDKSAYEALEVTSTAGDAGIRSAYEQLARRFHRDRFRSETAAVQKIADQAATFVSQAYEQIATSEKRVEYAQVSRREATEDKDRAEAKRVLRAEASFQQGEAALRSRDYESALAHFGTSVQAYPEEGEYHAHYGWALHLCHPDDIALAHEAMEHVKRGIKLARDREKPYLFLGRLCKAVGRLDAAEKMFTKAVQVKPECVEAIRELRLINMRREKGKGLIGRLLGR